MNCEAFRPAVTKTVVSLSNLPTSRSKFVFRPPHKPLSVLTMITARFFTGRTSIKGFVKSPVFPATAERTSFISAAYGRPDRAACCAFRILAEATICIALVIWAVFLTDLMRRRMSRVLGMGSY